MGSFGGRVLATLVFFAASAGGAQAATYAKGVDVSHWQGPIQWPNVASASYTFAFGKATEGKTLIDPTYSINRSGAETVGLHFGAYHFGRPGGSGDAALVANAIAQADFFLDVAEPQPGELPPVLDLESKGGLAAAALQTWTTAWLDQVAARTGVRALVYSSPNFWKTALGDTTGVADGGNPLWVAHWTTNAAPLVPGGNWGGQSWTFWQFTNKARVSGFAHPVDGDRFRGPDPSVVAIPAYPTGSPAPSSPPTIVGTAQTGRTLAGVPGAWAGGKPVSFAYQWQRCDASGAGCGPIVGAIGETYVPVTDDVGHALLVTVTAQSATGSASGSSAPTAPIGSSGSTVVRPAATSAPAVIGTPQVGQVLTSSVGTWTGAPSAFAYQWQRCSATGTPCAAIVGANASSYTLTPDDIGATISLVVTATGLGGSASAPPATTTAIAAAPVPPAVAGSAVAQAGAAGAVVAADGSATVTWQPGAVPAGSTVSLTRAGKGLQLAISPAVTQLAWPIDLVFAAPTANVIGWSVDGVVWLVAPQLATAVLPVAKLAGSYVDAGGLSHVLLRTPARVRLFERGVWGDPSLVAAGPPSPRLLGPLRVRRLRDGSVLMTGRVRVPSQAHLWVSVQGPTKQSLVRKPGTVPLRVRLSGKRFPHGTKATLRVAARDPWGRKAALVTRFRAP